LLRELKEFANKQNYDVYTYICHLSIEPEEYPRMLPKAIQEANIAFAALHPKRPISNIKDALADFGLLRKSQRKQSVWSIPITESLKDNLRDQPSELEQGPIKHKVLEVHRNL